MKMKRFQAAVISFLSFISFLYACNNSKENIYGIYRISVEDPNARLFVGSENIYLQIKKDQTIVYNTTINQKPKFHVEGSFTLDEKSNTLNIKWKEGKLPGQLKVEKAGDGYQIQIGKTRYVKQPSGS